MSGLAEVGITDLPVKLFILMYWAVISAILILIVSMISIISSVWSTPFILFLSKYACVLWCRYSGILSAYGMALADVISEQQRPFSSVYSKGNDKNNSYFLWDKIGEYGLTINSATFKGSKMVSSNPVQLYHAHKA